MSPVRQNQGMVHLLSGADANASTCWLLHRFEVPHPGKRTLCPSWTWAPHPSQIVQQQPNDLRFGAGSGSARSATIRRCLDARAARHTAIHHVTTQQRNLLRLPQKG
eukprot:4459836-Prymnesium_polylepis.1